MLDLERLLRLPGVLARQVRGVAHLDHVVVDVEVGQRLRLPLDDDGVVAGVLQRGAEEAVGLRGGGAVGQGAARDHGEPARAPHRQPGQRPGGEDEAVVGVVPARLRPAPPRRGSWRRARRRPGTRACRRGSRARPSTCRWSGSPGAAAPCSRRAACGGAGGLRGAGAGRAVFDAGASRSRSGSCASPPGRCRDDDAHRIAPCGEAGVSARAGRARSPAGAAPSCAWR